MKWRKINCYKLREILLIIRQHKRILLIVPLGECESNKKMMELNSIDGVTTTTLVRTVERKQEKGILQRHKLPSSLIITRVKREDIFGLVKATFLIPFCNHCWHLLECARQQMLRSWIHHFWWYYLHGIVWRYYRTKFHYKSKCGWCWRNAKIQKSKEIRTSVIPCLETNILH